MTTTYKTIELGEHTPQGIYDAQMTFMRNPSAKSTTIRVTREKGETQFFSMSRAERKRLVEVLIHYMEIDGDLD